MATPPTMKRSSAVTMQDIADRCGVSKSTVAHALRGGPAHLAAATVARVKAMAQEMGYNRRHNDAAYRLALRKQGTVLPNHLVAVFCPPHYFKINYYAMTLHGLTEALAEAHYGVCLGQLVDPNENESAIPFPHVLDRGDLDGVFVTENLNYSDGMIQNLRANPGFGDSPIVSLFLPQPDCSAVVGDYRLGAYLAARHLLELGHRHIIQIVYRDYQSLAPTPVDRVEGVRQAYHEFDLDPDTYVHYQNYITDWDNPLSHNDTDKTDLMDNTLVAYVREHPEITGILALNDSYAIRIWYALHQIGLRVPEDISIIGFDDTDPLCDMTGQNQLTSVHLPLEELGRAAARLFLDRMSGAIADERTVVLPVELVVRHSTAPAAQRTPISSSH